MTVSYTNLIYLTRTYYRQTYSELF